MGDYIAVINIEWMFDDRQMSENIIITDVNNFTEAVAKVEKVYGNDLVQINNFTLLGGPFLKVSDKYLEKIMTGEIEE